VIGRAAVVLALLLSGCGGGESSAEAPDPAAEATAEPAGAVEATPTATPAPTPTPRARATAAAASAADEWEPPTIERLPDPAGFPDTPKGLSNGAFAPELDHTDLRTGDAVRLSDLVGPSAAEPVDAVIVGFTASWCGPCKQSYPYLEQMKKDHPGLRVVLVTVDAVQDDKEKHARIVADAGLDAPLLDPSADTLRAWLGQRRNVPHFYIINKIGEILVQDRGFGNNVKRVMPGQIQYALKHPEYVRRR